MNRKIAFFFGFVVATLLFGVAGFILSKQVHKSNEALFMSGYALKVSTLASLLDEREGIKREKIAVSEMCEAIAILTEKLKKEMFDVGYFETVVSQSISEYQLMVGELESEYCDKNI